MKERYLGCHLSSAAGFAAMGKSALSIDANTFAFFTRNPRGGKAKAIDEADVAELRALLEEHAFGKLVAHAPYTLNPCSAARNVRDFARICMEEDLARMEYLPGHYYNFHPGSHVGQGAALGVELITGLLNAVIKPEQHTTVLLETMSGKGSEIGSRFEELAEIIAGVDEKEKIGVCLDTCHVSDAGYPLKEDLDGVLAEFDRVIGLDRLKALHLNDSQNSCGAKKDRHARIGEGHLGSELLCAVVRHPLLAGLPCILETPQDTLDGYAAEIALLRKA